MLQLRLLVIDDSESDFVLTWHALRQAGIRVEGQRVESPGELAAALEGQRWDLCLLDWVMPQMTTPEAMRLLRQSHPDVPCIVWSGRDDSKVRYIAETVLGAVAFVHKGTDPKMTRVVELAMQYASRTTMG